MEKCRRIRVRGFGLATVLMIALFLGVLLTVLIGASSSTLSVVRHSEGTTLARSAAQSALAKALYELRQDPDFGRNGERIDFTPKENDEFAAILFDPDEALKYQVPVSVNNLQNAESVPDDQGGVVPARTVRLYAVGRAFKEKRTIVLDLHIPPYPYAIATEGSFESHGELSLTGLSSDTGERIPGHLATNGSSQDSLKLGPNTEISGDLVSVGGIELADKVEVDGEVRPYSSPKSIPKIDITQYDPRSFEGTQSPVSLDSSFYRDPSLQGKVLREGDLTLCGEISLDGALLYVEGNLEISGSVSGRGAIVATGDVSVTGVQQMTSDNELALLTGGSLSIRGNGIKSSRLEGLIYSEGDVEVRNSTIQGTLISQSNGGTTPRVVMERVELVYDSESAEVSVDLEKSQESEGKKMFLAFSEDGFYSPGQNQSCAAGGCLLDALLESSFELTGRAFSSFTGLLECESPAPPPTVAPYYVGIQRESDGRYTVFPSDGSAPRTSLRAGAAWLRVGIDVAKQLPDLRSTVQQDDFMKVWPSAARQLFQEIRAMEPAPSTSSSTSEPSMGMELGDNTTLEIDPMRFLKYGDEMRIRAVRMLEVGRCETGEAI